MNRNLKGIIGYAIIASLSIIVTSFFIHTVAALVIPLAVLTIVMIGREIYLYKTGQAVEFEYDDVLRYFITLLTSSIITTLALVLIGNIE